MSDNTDTTNKTAIDRCCAIVSACGIAVSIWLDISHNSAGDFAAFRPPISLTAAGGRSEATLEFFS